MKKTLPSKPILPVLEDMHFDLEEEALYEGAHFQDQDLSYSNSENIALRGCQLDSITLFKARFDHFECSNAVFNNCDLSNLECFGASFHQVQFNNCKLTGTNFSESYLRDCIFEGCIGEFAAFSSTNLKVVRFSNCRLPKSEFFEAKWNHLLLQNCDLDDSNWFRTKLNGLDFRSNTFQKIALSEELLKGMIVNQEQAICIAAGLGLVID